MFPAKLTRPVTLIDLESVFEIRRKTVFRSSWTCQAFVAGEWWRFRYSHHTGQTWAMLVMVVDAPITLNRLESECIAVTRPVIMLGDPTEGREDPGFGP